MLFTLINTVKLFSLSPNFPRYSKNRSVSPSGKSKNRIPHFPCCGHSVAIFIFPTYFTQNAVVNQPSPEKKSAKVAAGSSQLKKSQSSLLAGAVKRKGYVIFKEKKSVAYW